MKEFSGLVLDAQQKDRELAALTVAAEELKDKVSTLPAKERGLELINHPSNTCTQEKS